MTPRSCCAGHIPPHAVVRAILRRVAAKCARMNGDSITVAVQHVSDAYDIAVDGSQLRLPEGDER